MSKTIEPKIDLLCFNSLSTSGFVKRYRRDVRTFIHWNMIKSQKTGIKVLNKDDEVYLTIWSHGKSNFSFGQPSRLCLGDSTILVRVPAVKAENFFFIVDGTHRISELNPTIIVVDYILLERDEYGIVVDFLGDFFSNKLRLP